MSCEQKNSAGSATLRYDVASMQLSDAAAKMTWQFSISGEAGGTKYECRYDAALTLDRR